MTKRQLTEIALVLLILVGINRLAARHYRRWDVGGAQTFALSPRTTELLHSLTTPTKLLVFFIPRGEDKSLLYPYVRELCDRAAAETSQLTVEYQDLDRDLDRLRKTAARYGVSDADLAAGVIVLDNGQRSRFLTRDELGELDYGNANGPQLRRWTGESALANALLGLAESKSPRVCFGQGHGEAAADSYELGGGAELAEAIKHDQFDTESIVVGDAAIPERCDVLALIGPTENFADSALVAIAKHLEQGKKLFVLAGPTINAPALKFTTTGLEALLGRWGIGLPSGIVVDEPRLPGNAVGFVVTDGYRAHPIARRLVGRRTIWVDTRPVVPQPSVGITGESLIVGSERGWIEHNLGFVVAGPTALARDADDQAGPISLAVAVERTAGTGQGARIVVIGSVELALNRQLTAVHRDLILSSLGWLVKSAPRLEIKSHEPERFEVRLDDAQRRRVWFVTLLGMPLLALLFAVGVFWLRRS